MKHKLTKMEKKVLLFESIFVVGVLMYLFFATAPSQIYPLNGMVVSESDFNIEIENGEQVLISTTDDFEDWFSLEKGKNITLEPGIYYWKVKGRFRESEVKSFTIDSVAGLDILERKHNYEIINSGENGSNATKEKGGLIGSWIFNEEDFENSSKEKRN